MLEIIALYYLCKGMGKVLRNKGRNPLFMQIAVVICWFGSMFMSAFIYGIILVILQGPNAAEEPGLILYPIMLLAALFSQAVLFGIAYLWPEKLEYE